MAMRSRGIPLLTTERWYYQWKQLVIIVMLSIPSSFLRYKEKSLWLYRIRLTNEQRSKLASLGALISNFSTWYPLYLISSFKRSTMKKCPSESYRPISPVWNQPSLSIALLVASSLLRYPKTLKSINNIQILRLS